MLVIGLTGGIASGKSTVSRYLRQLGAPVVDADAIVHELQMPGTTVLQAIVREFGTDVAQADGSLDRRALGRIVFTDPSRRKALEAIVHPAVRERMGQEVEAYRQAGRLAVVLDVPLLIEGGLYKTVDRVWLVYADRATQQQRLMVRDLLTVEEADQRIAAQMDLTAKLPFADLVIDNQGVEEQALAQVRHAWEEVVRG